MQQNEATATGNITEKSHKSHAQNLKNTNIKYLQRIFALPAIQYKRQFFAKMY